MNFLVNKNFFVSEKSSLEEFKKAVKLGLDLRLTVRKIEDGTLVVYASEALKNSDGYLATLKKEDLKQHKIATLEEVLKLANGKCNVLLEVVSACTDFVNNGKMERQIVAFMENFNGEWAVESTNPYVVMWFKLHAPTVVRGQKSSKPCSIKRFFKKAEPNFVSLDEKYVKKIERKFKGLVVLAV